LISKISTSVMKVPSVSEQQLNENHWNKTQPQQLPPLHNDSSISFFNPFCIQQKMHATLQVEKYVFKNRNHLFKNLYISPSGDFIEILVIWSAELIWGQDHGKCPFRNSKRLMDSYASPRRPILQKKEFRLPQHLSSIANRL
jgi:hypothetical protein